MLASGNLVSIESVTEEQLDHTIAACTAGLASLALQRPDRPLEVMVQVNTSAEDNFTRS